MMLQSLVLLCLLLGTLATDVQYVVGIRDKFRPLVPGVRTVPMTSLNGNKFICSIPSSADPTDLASLQASLAADIKDSAETKTEVKKSTISAEQLLFEKLRRNLKGHCLEKTDGYWTYEVCPFVAVRQFHKPPGAGPNTHRDPLFSLGTHVSKYNAVFSRSLASAGTSTSSKSLTIYDESMVYPPQLPYEATEQLLQQFREVRSTATAAQFFEGGSNKRHATVFFRCPAATPSAPTSTIVHINEPRAYSYLVIVETTYACFSEDAVAREKQLQEERRTAGPSYFLKPLLTQGQNCAQLLAGWWTYEFCLHRSVRQFHTEPLSPTPAGAAPVAGQPVVIRIVSEFSLGLFQGSEDGQIVVPSDNKQGYGGLAGGLKLNSLPSDQQNRAAEHRSYVKFVYTGGTPCDIDAGQTPRTTEVRLYCDESKQPQPLRIESVSEMSSCHYVLKAHSSALCQMNALVTPAPPVSDISCVPVPSAQQA